MGSICSISRASAKAVCGCLLALVFSGCVPGRRLGPSDLTWAHPAVRWGYEPGWQIGNFSFLFLPVVVTNEIGGLSMGADCIVVHESGTLAPELGLTRKPRYAFALEDGRLRPVPSDDLTRSPPLWERRIVGDVPHYLVAAGQSIVIKDGLVLFCSDKHGHVELLRPKKSLGAPVASAEFGDNLLVLAFSKIVLCVDKSRLSVAEGKERDSRAARGGERR